MSADPPSDNAEQCERLFSVKKALFVGAHPDDIESYCAGLVHMMRRRGADVVFAVGTRGGRGRSGNAKKRLESLRTQHQSDAAEILGGARVVLYDYPDGSLPQFVESFADDLKTLISREKPDAVFSWDPDYIYNPHPDHQAAADSVRIAAAGLNLWYYGTRRPDVWVGYGDDVLRVKLESIRAHRTETPWYYYPLVKRVLVKRLTREGRKIGAKYAEVLRRATS